MRDTFAARWSRVRLTSNAGKQAALLESVATESRRVGQRATIWKHERRGSFAHRVWAHTGGSSLFSFVHAVPLPRARVLVAIPVMHERESTSSCAKPSTVYMRQRRTLFKEGIR